MGKRGPKSGDTVNFKPESAEKGPGPPVGMNLKARRIWKAVVASLPPAHFRPGDYPLLRAYCEAEALHHEASKKIGAEGAVVDRTRTETKEDGSVVTTILATKTNPWVAIQTQTAHTMSQLATKLRLCANSRFSGPEAGNNPPKPKSAREGLLFQGDEWPYGGR